MYVVTLKIKNYNNSDKNNKRPIILKVYTYNSKNNKYKYISIYTELLKYSFILEEKHNKNIIYNGNDIVK